MKEKRENGKTVFVTPSQFNGLMIVVVDDSKARAPGNPYPKRGQIKKKIFSEIVEWVASACSSIDCPAAEINGDGWGSPCPKREEIKLKILKK